MVLKKTVGTANNKSDSKRISTGVAGLDLILQGGYPRGCPTIIRGVSGCGKTIYALSFATSIDNGQGSVVYMTFDEAPERLKSYIKDWHNQAKITFLDARSSSETQILNGPIDLTALLVRVENAINRTGAKNLVIDAFDILFSTFKDDSLVHQGLSRVFNWCRDKEITLVATTGINHGYEVGTGLLDYASDCTIFLNQVLDDSLMTRQVQVIKNRGGGHGTNAYPYIIDFDGISLSPITETQMTAPAGNRHISTGIEWLDKMLGGKGLWFGSAVMISGQSGTGKSLLAASIAQAACESGLKVLYYSFEESPSQYVRDVASAGIRLKPYIKSGTFIMRSERVVERGLEEHVIRISRLIEKENPDVVVFDPISAIGDMGNSKAFKSAVIRLCYFLKNKGHTVVMTELLGDDSSSFSSLNISSLVDTWIRLRRTEKNNTLGRQIYIHKSRGEKTSTRVADFEITSQGLKTKDTIV